MTDPLGQGIWKIRTPAGDRAWVVTSYALGRRLLGDDRLGRSCPSGRPAPRYSTSPLFGRPWGNPEDERAEHLRFRTLLSRSFSPGRMEGLRPTVARVVDRCLDELREAGPPADIHAHVARPLPVRVMCVLLGVPHADYEVFAGWADAWTSIDDAHKARAGKDALENYFTALVSDRRGSLGEDAVSDFIQLAETSGAVSTEEVVALSATLLFAGYETTAAAMDKALMLILSHEPARAALWADTGLRFSAIEEVLRFVNPLPPEKENENLGIVRYAHADVEVGEHPPAVIRAGDLVLIQKLKCNQDPSVFTDPERFDISRFPNRHLTFGHGRRYCPGAPLARLELDELFRRLPVRFPELRLTVGVDEVKRVPKRLTPQADALPVTW